VLTMIEQEPNDLSMRELARRVGVSRTTVDRRIENGPLRSRDGLGRRVTDALDDPQDPGDSAA
jgi:predicted DNA-binding transcriptional regulator AlpA